MIMIMIKDYECLPRLRDVMLAITSVPDWYPTATKLTSWGEHAIQKSFPTLLIGLNELEFEPEPLVEDDDDEGAVVAY